MKKKILVYSLGLGICLVAVCSIARKDVEKESLEVVSEERDIPVYTAGKKFEADALSGDTSLTENIVDTEEIEKTTEYSKK